MLTPELPNLSTIVERARSCPPATLLEVFIGLVSVTLPYIAHDRDCTAAYKNHVIASLSKLPGRAQAIPVAKAKPPPTPRTKKKPPPKKVPDRHLTTLSKRYALFWNPTTGHPPWADQADKLENVPDFLAEASHVFQVQIPELTGWTKMGQSVFDPQLLDDADRAIIREATNTEMLDSWFERQRKEVLAAPKIIAKSDGARQSVLGLSMAQRISILVHSLRKSISPKATVKDVKGAILSCTLGKEELTLLLDIIPNEDEMGSQRRLELWKEIYRSIEDLLKKDPSVVLTEDEEFLYFLMRLPNPTRRLQCMVIIPAFRHIVSEMERKLHWMIDAVDILLRNRRILLCWHLLLNIGNLLNEGTARSKQTWFTTGALRRALDVRGNKGMTLPEYLAAFAGPVLTPTEWRALQKAKDGGALNTYVAAKDVIDTFVSILRPASDPKTMLPSPLTDEGVLDGARDLIVEKMKQFTDDNFQTAQRLLRTFMKFVQMYAAAAYYFADPQSLLPLERGIDGDSDSEESPARDLFHRVAAFIAALRSKADADRVHSDLCAAPMPCSPRPQSSPRSPRTIPSPRQQPPQAEELVKPSVVAPQMPKLIKRLAIRHQKVPSPTAPPESQSSRSATTDPEPRDINAVRRFMPSTEADIKLPVRNTPIASTPLPPKQIRVVPLPPIKPKAAPETAAQRSPSSPPTHSQDKDGLPSDPPLVTPLNLTRSNENEPPTASVRTAAPVNRFRFGFRPGGRLLSDSSSLKDPSRNATTTADSDTPADLTMTSPDGITILAPRMPQPQQQRRRRPRSSIEATFALARDVSR